MMKARDPDLDIKVLETSEIPDDSPSKHPDIPDGGWGWYVCVGTFIVNFIVFGIHNSFGVVYANLLDELKMGKAETAWIGAMAMGLNFMFGPLTSLLCDRYSCRAVAFVGALLSVLGLFLTSFVQEPNKMYVTYGLLFGVGSSFSFVSSIVVLGDYFHKRLALVNGIATSGSGVGSLVTGPVMNYLLSTTGWQNSMRILSGFAVLLWVAAFLYRPNKRIDRTRRQKAKLFNSRIWKNRAYVLWVASVAVFQFGYLIPFVHLVKYAEDLGVSKSKGAWLIGFLSIMSTIGRVVFGKMCDFKQVKRLNVYQLSIFVIGISTIVCPLAKSYGGLIGYSLTFGFFDGCFVGQVAVITADIVGHENLSQGVGNLFGCLAIPMSLGPPVAGWLYDGFGSYKVAFYVSGSVAILSFFLIFVIPFLLRNREPRNEFDGLQPVSLTDSGAPVKARNDRSIRESSGYSSSQSGSEEYDGQPLISKGNFASPRAEDYLSGKKLRDLFLELERETVL